ncbi:uncharacterized protein B0T15DRAFT_517910 [Chaetomium strumarium]|uniref:Pal1 cell morphology protein n=1 Tax=Chaetomium strumarium TaxID=1170767 RepID=A0AAJ0M5W5_9PEZI|nr:hypothetical protein B0T15DRAFT_517910 [Chaetomium strumarium]
MDDRGYVEVAVDKQWASKYILGPLYDPEPNQVCATRLKPLPTPPASARSVLEHSSQERRRRPSVDHGDNGKEEQQPFFRRILSRTNSLKRKPLPPSPPRSSSKYYPPLSGLERKRSIYTANPPPTRWNQGTILSRANSTSSSTRPGTGGMAATSDRDRPRRRAGSLAERYPGDMSHRPLEMLTQEHMARERGDADTPPRRASSLRERYPGDMSHRPLAILTREHRAADRAPHLHNRRRQQPSDTIDSLDSTGPVPGVTYHHDGPFDATLKERNLNKKYAPIDAVRDTNAEALKATPREFVQDSLVKHVPLQGTAVVPPGMQDFGGRTMEYEEGADLMREEDAPGGAYKRWDHVRYRDGDLKGKGEPGWSVDQARRDERARGKQHAASSSSRGGTIHYYEMQPSSTFPSTSSHGRRGGGGGEYKEEGTRVRQRSVSNGAQLQPEADDDGIAGSSGLQRSNTTGKKLAQGLKRRFGSLRKKRLSDEAGA